MGHSKKKNRQPTGRKSEPVAPDDRTFLFCVEPPELPQPLPSLEVIENSPAHEVLKESTFSRCVCIDDTYVVKYGDYVFPIEGENLRYIRENTDVLVPKLFAVYQQPGKYDRLITYIVMEYIPGDSLENLWATLDDSKKDSIASELRRNFDTLRGLPCPSPGSFCSLQGQKLHDGIFYGYDDSRGPFLTENDLVQAILDTYECYAPSSIRYRAKFYRRVLPEVLRGNDTPVFTHNSLQQKNIIIQEDGTAVLLGWGESGWYPSYWEYATAMVKHEAGSLGWEDDGWHLFLGKILEEFPNQYVWMSRLHYERLEL